MKLAPLVCLMSLLGPPTGARAAASAECFIYRDGGATVADGDCFRRHPPQSTFKIAISLMGFNEGILIDETHPLVPFVEGDADDVAAWKQPHDPRLWMRNSCVWYSRFVTRKLGAERFRSYVRRFGYGNQDVSGEAGKDDGLTSSWITSSLAISPAEQVDFLERLLEARLPVSDEARRFTRSILFRGDLPGGWKLYGKTGTGDLLREDGSHDTGRERGWFVGWMERAERRVVFAEYLEVANPKSASAGFGYVASQRAREQAERRLLRLLSQAGGLTPGAAAPPPPPAAGG